jgi:hypothetical protein
MTPEQKLTAHLRTVFQGLDNLTDDLNLEDELNTIEASYARFNQGGNLEDFLETCQNTALARVRLRAGETFWDPTEQSVSEFISNTETSPVCWQSELPFDQDTIISLFKIR